MAQATRHQDYLNEHILSCHSLADAPLDAIHELILKDSFACVRGFIEREAITTAIAELKACFKPDNDAKLDPRETHLLRRNYQRLYVGGTSPDNIVRPRFLRTFYNPLWDEDIYQLHEVFVRVAQFRNLLNGSPRHFACGQPERGVWTAARIHHYPRGGGFMASHQDTTFYQLSQDLGFPHCLQIAIVMSEKGSDYQQGGAYIEVGGERIYTEDVYRYGDLLIMDHRIHHGVEEIDPLAPLDMTSLSGRLVGFCNLFRL